jgi:hypothetical protein
MSPEFFPGFFYFRAPGAKQALHSFRELSFFTWLSLLPVNLHLV